jgi:hypothetical protein
MSRESARRLAPGTAAAVAALVFAATPFADAAAGKARTTRTPTPVAHARFADNAARVNGYRATATPTAHTLLPLDSSGRFPSSVLPRGTTGGGASGPRGPAGPTGPVGPAGPSGLDAPGVVTIVFQADGTSASPSGSPAEALCPAGTKVLGGGFNDLTRTVPSLASKVQPGSVDEVQENDPFARSDGSSGWRVRIANVPPTVRVDATGAVVPNTLPAATTYFQSYAVCG